LDPGERQRYLAAEEDAPPHGDPLLVDVVPQRAEAEVQRHEHEEAERPEGERRERIVLQQARVRLQRDGQGGKEPGRPARHGFRRLVGEPRCFGEGGRGSRRPDRRSGQSPSSQRRSASDSEPPPRLFWTSFTTTHPTSRTGATLNSRNAARPSVSEKTAPMSPSTTPATSSVTRPTAKKVSSEPIMMFSRVIPRGSVIESRRP